MFQNRSNNLNICAGHIIYVWAGDPTVKSQTTWPNAIHSTETRNTTWVKGNYLGNLVNITVLNCVDLSKFFWEAAADTNYDLLLRRIKSG